MKKFRIISAFLFFLFIINNCSALKLTFIPLAFGINALATDTIDKALGEREIPPFPPPEGTLCYFNLYYQEATGTEVVGPYDYRPYPKAAGDTMQFHFFASFYPKGLGEKMIFTWDSLGDNVSYALFSDDKVGWFFQADMKKVTSFMVDNQDFEDFRITIVFSKLEDCKINLNIKLNYPVDVNENDKDRISLSCYPNPVLNDLYIQSENNISSCEIYDCLGTPVYSNIISENKKIIDFSGFSSGLYTVDCILQDGTSIRKKIIKFN
jgi:hypothetical protein